MDASHPIALGFREKALGYKKIVSLMPAGRSEYREGKKEKKSPVKNRALIMLVLMMIGKNYYRPLVMQASSINASPTSTSQNASPEITGTVVTMPSKPRTPRTSATHQVTFFGALIFMIFIPS
jgi:hypothetical protein